MIDLHCHILHGLDDGAIDLDDSVAMARQAEANGVEVVCATPHIHPDHEVRIDGLGGLVQALNDELSSRGIATRVRTGGEVAEPLVERLSDNELRSVSLGGSGRWILLEPGPGPLGDGIVRSVERLRERGFRSIVAHPERHAGAEFRETLERLVEAGALIQVTAALIAAGPASETMLELARCGLVHLLASDAHSSHGGRKIDIRPGLERLSAIDPTKAHLDWISTQAPAAILDGEEVGPPFPIRPA